ncbi:agamous-like MADS-box protein AGL29 [Durio zibethinus]|uniref:Agamous-like MADS-box protein AGL29 n=1 Tax=Durio zibethinus TaxID=66656 RepID=A0A6P6B9Y8_DURZI|nr:agamous-like MADS-box protein AGL29 [Durio zibethinus]XP_022773910.1 agamous-like MADS-box protein AGL29 [Durio zibethinus]XP_022773911.1 agamous-like MADS-box protein AGL29 [Durio zibethinus]
MAGLSSKGRRRTQMWMIQGADARQVAFSKRRSGLFKKASELCTLCAVETALVVFYARDQAFYFGHPGVGTVMNTLSNCRKPNFDAIHQAEAEQEANLLEKLEAEKIQGERIIERFCMGSQKHGEDFVKRLVDKLNWEQLLTLKSLMEEYKEKLRKRMQELSVELAAPTLISAGESNASLSGSTEGDSSADPHYHVISHEH